MEQVQGGAAEVDAVSQRIGRHFARSEPGRRAIASLQALLSDTRWRNRWQLAEYLGEATPDGVQHLLLWANWNANAVGDDLLADRSERPRGAKVAAEGGVVVPASIRASRGLVDVATPPPAPLAAMPRPETKSQTTRLNNYGCRTSTTIDADIVVGTEIWQIKTGQYSVPRTVLEDWLRVAGDSIQNGHAPTGTTKIVLAGDEIAAAAMRLNDDGTLPPGAVKTMFETLEKQYGKIFEIRKFKLFAP